MFKAPNYYVTPQEFADLIVETMEELGYFKADELSHPEDIIISFTTVGESIAKGMGHVIRRLAEEKQALKQAYMATGNLKKSLPDDPEYPVS